MSPPESLHSNEGDKKVPTEGAGTAVDHDKETAERKSRETKEDEDRGIDKVNTEVINRNIVHRDDSKFHAGLWARAEFTLLYPAPKDERPEARDARMAKFEDLKKFYEEQFQDPKKFATKRDMSVADKETYLRGLMKGKEAEWKASPYEKNAEYILARELAKIQGYQGGREVEAFIHTPDGEKFNTLENMAMIKHVKENQIKEEKAKAESDTHTQAESKPTTAPAPTPPSVDSPSTLKSFFESIGGFWGAVGLGILAFLGLQKGNNGTSLFENLFTSASDSLGFGTARKKAEKEAKEQKRVASVLEEAGIPINTDTAQSGSENVIGAPEKAEHVREMIPYLKHLAQPEGIYAHIEGTYAYHAGDAGTLKKVMIEREPEKNTARLTAMAEEFVRTSDPAHRNYRDFIEFVDKHTV